VYRKMAHKDYVMLQKEHMRILVYDKTPDEKVREMYVNIVVGEQDMTLSRYEFHKLVKLAQLVMEAERSSV
jgi:hypothetical protein